MQDLAVLYPTGYLTEQQIMPHGIEIGCQIHVDYPRLAVDNALLHPGHRRMRRPPGAIPVRAVAEVRLENGLHHELERPLHHPVPNRRNPQGADLASALGNLDAPVPQWPIGARDQFIPELHQKRLDTGCLDRVKRDAVNPWRPVVALCESIRGPERLQLGHVDVQAPKPFRRVSLRRDVDPPPQVLQTDGRRSHAAPASRVVGGIAEQQGPFAPRALPRFIATPDPSATLSPSAHFPGTLVIGPT